MLMAKVIGNVWTIQKEIGMENLKLLIVQPVNIDLKPNGNTLIAVDRIGAGTEELVLITQGSPAQRLFDSASPIDAAVVGIVDSYDKN